MSNDTDRGTCKPRKTLVGAHVRIEFSAMFRHKSIEDEAKHLEQQAEDFMRFVRDHRHQDVNSVYVEREYAELCTSCGEKWDTLPADQDGPEICGNCGATVVAD